MDGADTIRLMDLSSTPCDIAMGPSKAGFQRLAKSRKETQLRRAHGRSTQHLNATVGQHHPRTMGRADQVKPSGSRAVRGHLPGQASRRTWRHEAEVGTRDQSCGQTADDLRQ